MTSAVLGRRPLGSTGVEVTALCLGTSPLASMPGLYGYEVDPERAVATVAAVFESPINFLDTSNGYGDGDAERRIGRAIADRGGLPDGFVLSTKVDPDPRTGDFSAARVRASFEESLERLGLEKVHLLQLHDPERIGFEAGVAPGGPVEELVKLREEGLVDHLGVAGGPVRLLRQYLETGEFEVVLTHNRFTLLGRPAEPLIEFAAQRGIAVLNAAPYGGGMLAKGPKAQPKFAYGVRDGDVAQRAARMADAAERYGVPLAAAALQFSMRESRISSTVVGVSSPARVTETISLALLPIPDALWDELAGLSGDPVEGVD